jgi:exopolysaccharide biosynthesis WecB/TagA/CpsF family protein
MKVALDDAVASEAIVELNQDLPKRIRVARCPVDSISFPEVVNRLCERIEQRQRTHVVFVNAAKVVRYQGDSQLRAAIQGADFLLADGVPIVWASRLYGSSLPGRVNGTDLMYRMLRESADRGYRVFLLGARPEILQRCISEILRLYPTINIVGHRDGYFHPSEEEDVVSEINSTRADILFVGMPTPRKEIWGERHLNSLNIAVCQGVGGSFDVLAGLVKRAPERMQKCGLEWFFRFLQEPKRLWRRYLTTNASFLWFLFTDAIVFFRRTRSNEVNKP